MSGRAEDDDEDDLPGYEVQELQKIMADQQFQGKTLTEFFTVLAVCHNVVVNTSDGKRDL